MINVRVNGEAVDDPTTLKLANVRTLTADVVLEDEPDVAAATVSVRNVGGEFSYTVDWAGRPRDIQELGWAFAMPAGFDRFSWDRRARWSWYPDTHVARPRGTALPETARQNILRITRPDAFDFNSTKYDANMATLTDEGGAGLGVALDAEDRHHVRGGFGDGGAHTLVANKQNSPPRDLSSAVVPQLYLALKPGDVVQGSFRVGAARLEQSNP